MLTIITFILILGLLVFIHEMGHFLFAKRAGILVREFALGFGPKIFAKKVGETLYAIRILPLGGYVRMAGEDPEIHELKTGVSVFLHLNADQEVTEVYLYEPNETSNDEVQIGRILHYDFEHELTIQIENSQEQKRQFSMNPKATIHYSPKNVIQIAPWDRQFGSKKVGQKAMTIFAGPLFNIILTAFLFTLFVAVAPIQDLTIGKVLPNLPAKQVGIQAGDKIVAIDHSRIWTNDSLHYYLLSTKGKSFDITVERAGKNLTFPIQPEKTKENRYMIGVAFAQSKVGPVQAVIEGGKLTVDWTRIMLDSLGKLVTGDMSIKSLGGPVEMGRSTGEVAKAGLQPLIKWTALLSLNLGIINLLPIPALDGSRLLFIGLEAIRGKPINPNKESLVHFVGFAFLMMLMLIVTYNDIVRIFFA
ncbi:regulator of sigma E protease [Seinonella peptonophila]|uniref:Zinc metalloprotease n=1 Tax=Seinonella peptonophila TaxID=112248 RepID=A0A1M5AP61_9BACL|nr:RIP metalloprotease RseP [Seinonella peptonophila]SHF32029.1 regulator of sigma E protease [Seinonella peptonophila]